MPELRPPQWPLELRMVDLATLVAWVRHPDRAPAELRPLLADWDVRCAVNALARRSMRPCGGEPLL